MSRNVSSRFEFFFLKSPADKMVSRIENRCRLCADETKPRVIFHSRTAEKL